jgi:prephenate dehydrogenase
LDQAIELGVIDEMATFADLMHADFVIGSCRCSAHGCAKEAIGEQTIVLRWVLQNCLFVSIANHPKRRNFIATHPIAGTEFSGPSAAIKGCFKENIICEVEKTTFKLQERALAFPRNGNAHSVYGSKIA